MTSKIKKLLIIGGSAVVVIAVAIILVVTLTKKPVTDPVIDPDPVIVDPDPVKPTPEDPVQLETPKGISLEGSVLSWTPVANASKYIVYAGEKEIVVDGTSIDLAGKVEERDVLTVVAVGSGKYTNSTKSIEKLFISIVDDATIDSIYSVIVGNLDKNMASFEEAKYETTIRNVSKDIAYLGLEVPDVQTISDTIDQIINNINEYRSSSDTPKEPSNFVNFVVEQIDLLVNLDIDEMVVLVSAKEIAILYLNTYIDDNSPIVEQGRKQLKKIDEKYEEILPLELAKKMVDYLDNISTVDLEKLALVIRYIENYYEAIKVQLPTILEKVDTISNAKPESVNDGAELLYDLMTIKDQIVEVLLNEMPSYDDYNDVILVFSNLYETIVPEYLKDSNPIAIVVEVMQETYILNYEVLSFVKYIDAEYFKDLSNLVISLYNQIIGVDISKIMELAEYLKAGNITDFIDKIALYANIEEKEYDKLYEAFGKIISDVQNENYSEALNVIKASATLSMAPVIDKLTNLLTPVTFNLITDLTTCNSVESAVSLICNTFKIQDYVGFQKEKNVDDLINALMAKLPEDIVSIVMKNLNENDKIPFAIMNSLEEAFEFSKYFKLDYGTLLMSLNGEVLSAILVDLLQLEEYSPEIVLNILKNHLPIDECIKCDYEGFKEVVIKAFEGEFTDTLNALLALESFDIPQILEILGIDKIIKLDLPGLWENTKVVIGEDALNFVEKIITSKSLDEVFAYVDEQLSLTTAMTKFANDSKTALLQIYPIDADYVGYVNNLLETLNIDINKFEEEILAIYDSIATKLEGYNDQHTKLDVKVDEVTPEDIIEIIKKFALYATYGKDAMEHEQVLYDFLDLIKRIKPVFVDNVIEAFNDLTANQKALIIEILSSGVFDEINNYYDAKVLLNTNDFEYFSKSVLVKYLFTYSDALVDLIKDLTMEDLADVVGVLSSISSSVLYVQEESETLFNERYKVAEFIKKAIELYQLIEPEELSELLYKKYDEEDNSINKYYVGTNKAIIDKAIVINAIIGDNANKLYEIAKLAREIALSFGSYTDEEYEKELIQKEEYLKSFDAMLKAVKVVANIDDETELTNDQKIALKTVGEYFEISVIEGQKIDKNSVIINYDTHEIYWKTSKDENSNLSINREYIIINGKVRSDVYCSTVEDMYCINMSYIANYLTEEVNTIQFCESMYSNEDDDYLIRYTEWSDPIGLDTEIIKTLFDFQYNVDYEKGELIITTNENCVDCYFCVNITIYNNYIGSQEDSYYYTFDLMDFNDKYQYTIDLNECYSSSILYGKYEMVVNIGRGLEYGEFINKTTIIDNQLFEDNK